MGGYSREIGGNVNIWFLPLSYIIGAVCPYRISFVILMYNMYKDIVCVLLVQRTECTQWICYNHEYVVYIKLVNKLHRNIQHLLRKSIWRRQIWVDLYQPFRYLGFHEKATLSSRSLCSRLLVLHNETPVDDITKVKFEIKIELRLLRFLGGWKDFIAL